MEKQKHHNLVKRYVSFFTFCVVILLIGVIFGLPIEVEVHSVGEKPPFLIALLLSITLLIAAIAGFYTSYLSWFRETKTRANLITSMKKLANRFVLFRLPIYNPTFLFWYIRFITPIVAFLLLGLFLLVLFSMF